MKHYTTQNEKLLKILNERPLIMQDLVDISELDDDQLSDYQSFIKWYDSLPQFDKDLFYLLNTGYSVKDIALLFDCSESLIYQKRRLLHR